MSWSRVNCSYYYTLDWSRKTIHTKRAEQGQHSGKKGKGDYALPSICERTGYGWDFAEANYGKIAGIWFDGHVGPNSAQKETQIALQISLKLQVELWFNTCSFHTYTPSAARHHLMLLTEDFQMFEREIFPSRDNSGLSFQSRPEQLPLETEAQAKWIQVRFNIASTSYKSVKQFDSLSCKRWDAMQEVHWMWDQC